MNNIYIYIIIISLLSCRKNLVYKDYHLCLKNCAPTIEGNKIIFHDNCLNGSKIPSIKYATPNGQIINLNDCKKVKLINFWFIECPPCIEEISEINYIRKNIDTSMLEVIGLCRNEFLDFEKFMQKKSNEFTYPNYSAKSIIEDSLQFPFGYPTTLLIDGNGIIHKTYGQILKPEKAKENSLTSEKVIIDIKKLF